jgi:repressor LexA
MSDTEVKQTFSSNLRRYLSAYSHSQKDAAKALGIASQTFNNWCKGNSIPSIDTIDKLAQYFHCTRADLLENPSASSTRMSVSIPVLGRVAAGIPMDSIEEVIDREDISAELAKTGSFFGLRIKGDSMSPRIQDGDTVIVRSQEDAESDQIVIALINEHDGVCKKLRKLENGLMLISLNPSYEPMIFSKGEIDTMPVKIIGRVVEVRGKL